MKKRTTVILILAITTVTMRPLIAQKKVYIAKKTNPESPVIDGILDDPAWENANWDDNFVQFIPYEKTEPTEKTAFKVIYDDKNLYIAIRAYDAEPSKIVRRLSRRDEGIHDSDYVIVSIDSYHDYRTAYEFAVTTAGCKTDIAYYENGKAWDVSWNPVWYVATSVDESGWTAEMCIPFSQLRFPNREEQIWGMQIIRCIHRKQEYIQWQIIPKDSPGWIHLMGELRGVKGISSPIRIELLPYSTGKVESDQKEEGI